jgi:hypothetical protein
MRAPWSFEKSRKHALTELRGGMRIELRVRQFEERLASTTASPQMIALAAFHSVSSSRLHEACAISNLPDRIQCLRRIHVCWRYSAFGWKAYLHRAEQLATEFPKKAFHRSLPIGDIDVNYSSGILMTMALASVLGEDDVHDWFGNRCLQMLDLNEPYVDPEAWKMGPLQPFLTWLFCKWKHSEERFRSLGTGNLGPFQCVVDAWNSPEDLDKAIQSLCDLHVRKVLQILKPDDDFIFGLAVGIGYYVPIEILYIQRIRKELGLSVPQPEHPFLSQPMAKIPFPCPRSGYDPFIAKSMQLCRIAMPDLAVPWEDRFQVGGPDTSWIQELDLAKLK